jgi:hypothetical protein
MNPKRDLASFATHHSIQRFYKSSDATGKVVQLGTALKVLQSSEQIDEEAAPQLDGRNHGGPSRRRRTRQVSKDATRKKAKTASTENTKGTPYGNDTGFVARYTAEGYTWLTSAEAPAKVERWGRYINERLFSVATSRQFSTPERNRRERGGAV